MLELGRDLHTRKKLKLLEGGDNCNDVCNGYRCLFYDNDVVILADDNCNDNDASCIGSDGTWWMWW